VNVDSLRKLLLSYNPLEPLFFGEPFTPQKVYMGGGGGYVLSKAALDKFINILNDPRTDQQVGCPDRQRNTVNEDPYICIK
jgi:hypothetical protein